MDRSNLNCTELDIVTFVKLTWWTFVELGGGHLWSLVVDICEVWWWNLGGAWWSTLGGRTVRAFEKLLRWTFLELSEMDR